MSEGGKGEAAASSTRTESRSGRGGRGRGGGGGRGRGRAGGRGRHSHSHSHNSSSTTRKPPPPPPPVTTLEENGVDKIHGTPKNDADSYRGGPARGRGGAAGRHSRTTQGRGPRKPGARGHGRPKKHSDTADNDSENKNRKQQQQQQQQQQNSNNKVKVTVTALEVEDHTASEPAPESPSLESLDAKPPIAFAIATPSLPTPPTVTTPATNARTRARAPGVPMILTRQAHPPSCIISMEDDSDGLHIAEKIAAEALKDTEDEEEKKEPACGDVPLVHQQNKHTVHAADTNKDEQNIHSPTNNHDNNKTNPETSEKKRRKPKKKEKPVLVEEQPPPAVEVTTMDALKALPAQQVSITADSRIRVKRDDSSNSIIKLDAPSLLSAKTKKSKSRKTKGLSGDDAANQKAARSFNKSVRSCVERSDPDAMRDILHDKRNHNFALDPQVLETVMKAYVMAAMFDDALYCLRNCALPGTLSTAQTERILTCLPQNLRNSSAFTAADMINALCIATEFDKPTSRTYFMRIVRGIALEFLEEATSARDRICSAPCERLVRSAQCVVDAQIKRGKKPTDLVVEPGHQLGVFVPDTLENRGIQAGDAVSILPYAGPYPMSAESLDRNMIEATVTNTQPMVLRLQDKSNASLYAMLTEQVKGNVYRIDKLANRMGFNRQLLAAVSIASPLDDKITHDRRRPSPELIKAISAMDENIDRVMKQSGWKARGELTSTAALCAQAVPWNASDETDGRVDEDAMRDASALALETYGALEGLNASQQLAVQGASTNRLTLVQGPPGTGKTAVAIRILQHWARLAASEAGSGQTPSPILATSDSNIAVDNLVEGCANVGLRVVRLGRPEAIRPELLRYCIDRPQSSYGNSGSNSGSYGAGSALAFKEKMKNLKNAQVVCCTCIGSGGDILDNMVFDRVLVDEATQATEPAVLVPLTRGCRQLVLVGDHCQLPPTVLSTRAEEEGLGVPLFSRMVACGVPPFMLDTQYRMHPAIAMFPSDLFYGGKLRNGVSPPERRPLAGFPWPREEFPVAFVPVNQGIEVDDGVSKLNEAEAAAACDAVAALLAGGQCTVSDIAVVTPYAAQARLIRRMTRQLSQSGPPYVEVSSTDGFQGREKEAVVFSAVRSNAYGTVGFVSDWRRVNVSFTRARRALIVIGNDQTLRRGDPDTWMPWLAWADAHGVNMDKPGIPRGRYDPEQLRRVRGGTTAAEMLKDVLARQQAQLKTAERQLEKAEKDAAGHIIGSGVDGEDDQGDKAGSGTNTPKTLEQDLALLANTEGCWDDSDEEGEFDLHHSVSQPTLTTVSSSNDIRNLGSDDDGPLDAWDL